MPSPTGATGTTGSVGPASGRLCPDLSFGTLTISGVEMVNTPCWYTDVRPLWDSATVRGTDRILPGVTGVISYQRRWTVTKLNLPMVISGFVDRAGSIYNNPFVGLQINQAFLINNVVEPTGTNPGTRTATLTMPDSSTRTGPIHVETLRFGNQAGPLALAVLVISVPGGMLV